ncbi:unnamed protein product [Ambrosiozyma monospora]|uniref:Unnamed protein product n=1 Tax=Ambrosiozyma monospora TaxID=43982 RepID=A0A9W6WKQ5_AMBMO|nr:unnamed protein product [Ambrosiozyma monospora]
MKESHHRDQRYHHFLKSLASWDCSHWQENHHAQNCCLPHLLLAEVNHQIHLSLPPTTTSPFLDLDQSNISSSRKNSQSDLSSAVEKKKFGSSNSETEGKSQSKSLSSSATTSSLSLQEVPEPESSATHKDDEENIMENLPNEEKEKGDSETVVNLGVDVSNNKDINPDTVDSESVEKDRPKPIYLEKVEDVLENRAANNSEDVQEDATDKDTEKYDGVEKGTEKDVTVLKPIDKDDSIDKIIKKDDSIDKDIDRNDQGQSSDEAAIEATEKMEEEIKGMSPKEDDAEILESLGDSSGIVRICRCLCL